MMTTAMIKPTELNYFRYVFNVNEYQYKETDKVAVIDGDGSDNFPNLSLQKISAWEKRNGVKHVRLIKLKSRRKNGVLGIHPDSIAELNEINSYNRVYASFIFTRSKPISRKLKEFLPNVILGGTGVDQYFEMGEGDHRARPKFITQLPPQVENMYPDHALYESEFADENTSFWTKPSEYKAPKKYNDVVSGYRLKPVDSTWGETGETLPVNNNVVREFDDCLQLHGYDGGNSYRGSTRGNGYSSKGCPRKCTFCVVPVIQGDLTPMGYGLLGVINWILPRNFYPTMDEIVELYKANRLYMRPHLFWDSKGNVKRVSPFLTISDNNFPADPTCIEKMDYMIENNIAVNINQGMDARLLTAKERTTKEGVTFPSGDAICEKLSKLHFINFNGTKRQLHFSWDFLGVGRLVLKGITKLVEEYGLSYSNFTIYCLSGFNTTFEDDYKRVLTLKELGIDPYVMLFRNVDGSEGTKFDGEAQDWRMKHLARWTNNKILFRATTFDKYDYYVAELEKRNEGDFSEEQDIVARLECFDWLTEDYVNHA